MRSISSVIFLILSASIGCHAFGGSFTGSKLIQPVVNHATVNMEYIPNGMSKEQWRKIKEAEKKKIAGKNLGKTGITTFQSRTFAEWQKSGGRNLFPVDPKKVKDPKEIPYMQRPGGKPDDSDLRPKKSPFGSLIKKKEEKPKEEPTKKSTNWWTL